MGAWCGMMTIKPNTLAKRPLAYYGIVLGQDSPLQCHEKHLQTKIWGPIKNTTAKIQQKKLSKAVSYSNSAFSNFLEE